MPGNTGNRQNILSRLKYQHLLTFYFTYLETLKRKCKIKDRNRKGKSKQQIFLTYKANSITTVPKYSSIKKLSQEL